MIGWTRLLLAGVAVWAISSCPARGNIANGDFSDGLTGWVVYVADTNLAQVDASSGQLQICTTTNYAYDSTLGIWRPQPSDDSVGYVEIIHDIVVNGGSVPIGANALQFTADVQISGIPAGNTSAGATLHVNYAGQYEPWVQTMSTAGPQTITIDLPGVGTSEVTPDLDLAVFSLMDVSPTDTENTYSIVVNATFDNFKFVPEELATTVPIDIKPGTYPNSINLGSNGVIPVAICSTETFDALQVDPLTVTLADAGIRIRGKGKMLFATGDVNDDGLLDMILGIDTQGLALSSDATEAVLQGMTYGGLAFQGIDQVRIVPETSPDGSAQSALPEPSSIMLLILGGMSVLRRRRLGGNNRK